MSENKTDSTKINQQVDNVITEDIRQKINSVYDSLVVNQPRGKLPEAIFQEHFLPFFAGEQSIASNSKVMEQWISVAGTPMSEVDIIDNTGKVLFAVPSLFDTKIIDSVIGDRKTSLSDIYINSNIRASRIPAEGAKYLSDALNDKADSLNNKSGTSVENTNRWSDIMKRYGKQLVKSPTATSDTPQQDDDFEY